VFEITDYGGMDGFPYMIVTCAGYAYGCEGMGRGELSLLLTYWSVSDLTRNSILFLEEPETHVSPKSQDALMNTIAKQCDEMGVWVIVTTHSPTIIRRIPRERLGSLHEWVVLQFRSRMRASWTKLDIQMLLGGGVAFKCVVLVEDEAAKSMILTFLQALDVDLYGQCEVAKVGSKDDIAALLKLMPRTREWLTLIGAFDGDQRADIKGDGFKWPFCFLPGDCGPEELLIRCVAGREKLRIDRCGTVDRCRKCRHGS
jgi:hypothetical protein